MNGIGLFFLGVFVPVGISVFLYYFTNSSTDSYRNINRPACACVFDIDGTLTCGNPDPIIDTCIRKNCELFINTARPVVWLGGILTSKLSEPYYSHPKNYYFNPDAYSQSAHEIANTKLKHLDAIRKNLSLEKKDVFFFEDNLMNARVARENGYPVLVAGKYPNKCGYDKIHHETFSGIYSDSSLSRAPEA